VKTRTSKHGAAWRWVAPAALVLGLLILVPAAFLLYVSLTGYELGFPWAERAFVGLGNYQELLGGSDYEFWISVRRSVEYAILVTAGSLLLGMGVALLLNATGRGRTLVTLVVIMPLAISHAIGGLMWKLMYNVEFGILNHILGVFFGLKVNWLSHGKALYAAAVVGIWMAAPFAALFFLAGLQALPRAPFEAARVDGASGWQVFRHLTLPLLRPILLVVTLFTVIDALRSFGSIYLLTEGGPGVATLVLPLYMYRTGFGYSSILGKGSAIAFVLILLTMALAGILVQMMRRAREA
jgi:multiple sugar transport system permease protein